MVLAESKTVSFDDFITWLPERSAYRYELRDGEILEMPKPGGKHSEIAGFIISELNFIIRQSRLPYLTPRESIVKSIDYLVDGEYDLHQFRGSDRIQSPTFPNLELSIDKLV
jgi:Uma2 family endonuclease